ncbi:MAG TPA: SCO family protein [Sphingomicrobium sp.]|nr:SCO family protein [Sphingomicrobium sp.]
MTNKVSSKSQLKRVRIMLWGLVALALVAAGVLFVLQSEQSAPPQAASGPVKTSFGGPFTLIGANGKPFSSQALEGKPYAIYFGFTRCGDVCPTTLSRLVKLRREAANDQAMQIVFVTIDPANDGPKQVGQYAGLFNAPIVGLTGSQAQIDAVKKQYGIYAQPVPDAPMGKQMEHSATVLLFDRTGNFAGAITPDDGDDDALAKLRKLVA